MPFGRKKKKELPDVPAGQPDSIEAVPVERSDAIGSNGFEGLLPGTNMPIEASPDKGIKIGGKDEKELKDEEIVNLISREGMDFGIINRLYKVRKLPDGKVELSPLGDPQGPQDVRDELAKYIVRVNRKAIREEAVLAVEEALKRKDINTLVELREATDRGRQVHIESRRGCMYLKIGRRSTIL